MKSIALLVTVVGAIGVFAWRAPADDRQGQYPAAAAVSDVQDVIFLDDHRPVLLRLHIRLGEQSFQARWEDFMRKLFDDLDVNRDGILSPREARRAPSASELRVWMNGQFGSAFGDNATLAALDRNKDGIISRDELRHYYRRNGAGPLQFTRSALRMGLMNPVTERLFELLDTNKDGKLSRPEIEAAARVLGPLDRNDNELIELEELSPTFRNAFMIDRPYMVQNADPVDDRRERFCVVRSDERPGHIGRLLLDRYGPPAAKAPAKQSVPARLLGNFLSGLPVPPEKSHVRLAPKQIALSPAVFCRLDRNHDGVLDGGELDAFCQRPADIELAVSLGRTVHVTALSTWSNTSAAATGVILTLGRKQINVRADPVAGDEGASLDDNFGLRSLFLQEFHAADTHGKGYVERKDLNVLQRDAQLVWSVFWAADRNGDGRLTEQEFLRYLDLRMQATGASVRLGIADLGPGLFELIDTNRDGALGPRELRQTWKRLSVWDRNHDGFIERNELPHQFQLTVMRHDASLFGGPGYTLTVHRQPPTRGPLWFRKMDRNGDGDVSRREFLGTADDFRRLDTDGDGLIDVHEAEQAIHRFAKH